MGGHKYQDRMKNFGPYTHTRNWFLPLPPFTRSRRALRQQLYFFISVFWIPPPNVWHKYQDVMKNVGLFTYPRNSSLSLPHARWNCARTTAVCLYFCICNITQDNAEQYNRINEIENFNGIGAHICINASQQLHYKWGCAFRSIGQFWSIFFPGGGEYNFPQLSNAR